MDALKKFYDALREDPYKIFMVMPDGQVLLKKGIHDMADCFSGPFAMNELHVMPGSYNPLHVGHRWIFDKIPGSDKKTYEISLSRWGKEDLSFEELKTRLKQFEFYAPVLVTNCSTFLEKSAVIRSVGVHSIYFHVGIDTIERLIDNVGLLGVAGIPANFEVYDRDLGQGRATYPLPKWDGKKLPGNVWRSLRQVDDSIIDMSSTKLRNNKP